jgi:hypothetical protein
MARRRDLAAATDELEYARLKGVTRRAHTGPRPDSGYLLSRRWMMFWATG